MKKPYNAEEWDGYPMPDIPSNRAPLSKEEEDKLITELHKRAQKRLAEQSRKQTKDKKAV